MRIIAADKLFLKFYTGWLVVQFAFVASHATVTLVDSGLLWSFRVPVFHSVGSNIVYF